MSLGSRDGEEAQSVSLPGAAAHRTAAKQWVCPRRGTSTTVRAFGPHPTRSSAWTAQWHSGPHFIPGARLIDAQRKQDGVQEIWTGNLKPLIPVLPMSGSDRGLEHQFKSRKTYGKQPPAYCVLFKTKVLGGGRYGY